MNYRLLICFLLFSGAMQGTEILDRRIDVRFRELPLKSALNEVAQKGSFEWSYNAGIIDADQPVSLEAKNWTVREILYRLLGEGYQFKPNGEYLILKKAKKTPGELSGYIKDTNGEGIANATVYDKKTLRKTNTDQNGYYRIKVNNSSEIVVAKLSYRDTLLSVRSTTPRFQTIDLYVDSVPYPTNQITLHKEVQQIQYAVENFFEAGLNQWDVWNVADSLHRRMQFSLLPTLGTNHRLSGQVTNDWSLNVLAGSSKGNLVLEIGGLANFTQQDNQGVQIAGLLNVVHRNNRGVQIAGLVNETGDTLRGIQIAGLVNHAGYSEAAGVQIAGLVNTVGSGETHLQVAGIVNSAKKATGIQIAGIHNHARWMQGVQIGLVNYTSELEGVQIGLINRANGRTFPVFNWGAPRRAL